MRRVATEPTRTADLLLRWHGGDREALAELLREEGAWITAQVRRRLGPSLRRGGDTVDHVQDMLVEVLTYAPRFVVEDRNHFRGLLARILENNLRDKHDWLNARRRAAAREQSLPSGTVLQLGISQTSPSAHADRNEQHAYLRLAMELLDPDERQVVLLRQWEELPFRAVAERIGIGEEAARTRFRRAVQRLAELVSQLQRGELAPPPVD